MHASASPHAKQASEAFPAARAALQPTSAMANSISARESIPSNSPLPSLSSSQRSPHPVAPSVQAESSPTSAAAAKVLCPSSKAGKATAAALAKTEQLFPTSSRLYVVFSSREQLVKHAGTPLAPLRNSIWALSAVAECLPFPDEPLHHVNQGCRKDDRLLVILTPW